MSLKEILKFIQGGSYLKLKQEEEKLYLLKNMIRAEQDELNLKRMVWKEHGVIGEFETCRQYSYNHLDLNVLLLDLGILHLITFVRSEELLEEDKEKLKDIQIPGKYFLRFTASNDLRAQISDSQYDPNLNNIRLIEKVALWRESYNKFELLNNHWKKVRLKVLESSDCKLSQKITCGTLSIVESPPFWFIDIECIATPHIPSVSNVKNDEFGHLIKLWIQTAKYHLRKHPSSNLQVQKLARRILRRNYASNSSSELMQIILNEIDIVNTNNHYDQIIESCFNVCYRLLLTETIAQR